MKKFLLKGIIAIVLLTLVGSPAAFAQICTPDPGITAAGIYPNPLPDGCVGDPYNEKVDFAFPADTVYGGFTVPFDSFVVNTVLNVPAGLMWECNAAPSCTYYGAPPALTTGCVVISGTPTAATLPTDSVEVLGSAWITVFGFPVEIEDTIRIGLLIENCTGINEALKAKLDLNVYPNPVNASSVIDFNLVETADVKVDLVDLYGREVAAIVDEKNAFGPHKVDLYDRTNGLAPGVYFVRVNLNNGMHILTEKIILTK